MRSGSENERRGEIDCGCQAFLLSALNQQIALDSAERGRGCLASLNNSRVKGFHKIDRFDVLDRSERRENMAGSGDQKRSLNAHRPLPTDACTRAGFAPAQSHQRHRRRLARRNNKL